VRPSPLGILIHPRYGLWHAYRAALAIGEEIPLPPRDETPDLCGACAGKPCLTTCPVGAFEAAGYDVGACAGHLHDPAGADCMTAGCRARRVCPVGEAYAPAQAAFHMAAFRMLR
jgi:epoxyqueuosine reductase QueG